MLVSLYTLPTALQRLAPGLNLSIIKSTLASARTTQLQFPWIHSICPWNGSAFLAVLVLIQFSLVSHQVVPVIFPSVVVFLSYAFFFFRPGLYMAVDIDRCEM